MAVSFPPLSSQCFVVVAGKRPVVLRIRHLAPRKALECRVIDTSHNATFAKSMNPRSTSCLQLRLALSPTSRPWLLVSFPSTGWSKSRTHVRMSDAPVTMAPNRSPIRGSNNSAATDCLTCRSTRSASFFFSVQRPKIFQLVRTIGQWRSRKRGFSQSLRDQIWETLVGGRGMSTIFDRQTEMYRKQ